MEIGSGNESERKRKQKYLKEQIVNSKYMDQEEFVDFLNNAKQEVDGINIDNWTFDELVYQVQRFKFRSNQLKGRIYRPISFVSQPISPFSLSL